MFRSASLYPRPTKLEGGYTGFTLSVRPSVCRRHGFRSISQVCFGIAIWNFICILMVVIGRSLLIFIIYWLIFHSSGFHHICNIKCRFDCRYSSQNIFNAKNFNPHKKPISLLNVPICTQGMQRTWWPEAGTIIVTGPYCHIAWITRLYWAGLYHDSTIFLSYRLKDELNTPMHRSEKMYVAV